MIKFYSTVKRMNDDVFLGLLIYAALITMLILISAMAILYVGFSRIKKFITNLTDIETLIKNNIIGIIKVEKRINELDSRVYEVRKNLNLIDRKEEPPFIQIKNQEERI